MKTDIIDQRQPQTQTGLHNGMPKRLHLLSETSEISKVRLARGMKVILVSSEGMGLAKRHLCTVDEFRVFLVNGEHIRNHLETDFTMGSNHKVSGFIPRGEVWVDDRVSENDRLALIYHEIVETRLMEEHNMTYEEAHAIATESEKGFREQYFEATVDKRPNE